MTNNEDTKKINVFEAIIELPRKIQVALLAFCVAKALMLFAGALIVSQFSTACFKSWIPSVFLSVGIFLGLSIALAIWHQFTMKD